MAERDERTLVLFDIDGTLTKPRLSIEQPMIDTLKELRKRMVVGVVGGSDQPKIQEQLGGGNIEQQYDYVFSENGLVAFRHGVQLPTMSIKEYYGNERLNRFINFVLRYIADLDIPVKRGTFIEFRNGMLNVSPIGRNCSYEERLAFNEYDEKHNIRSTMVSVLEKEFADYGFKYSIGGQISFDVFPIGWDKTYCLRHVKGDGFTAIHFFGDKTYEGGNDYEIFSSPDTVGHTVTSPEDTIRQLKELFLQ
eukprot:comp24608_c0_seq1/m.46797 comp24608_c0_seq1/g.46797  ORF comp24608_c0_seq1/g.46797 comp24608_c0_seq1/m.46797 type:complete len:250 (-) comp24608_c0_seq1:483-1232(-)